uniref:COP9 signalosome complex subunit 6 n=1 Tax=Globodera rostochiensis TaxID=31243 RepID=A0A914HVM9_GLORO
MAQGVSTVLIHSVVALHISDHWTRVRVQNESLPTVCGALLGKHSGRNIEISNAFELKASASEDGLAVDEEYFTLRSALYKETFADLDFLGFYVTCQDHEHANDADAALQRRAMNHSEAPVLLKFNANEPVICDKLSITVFDSRVDPSDEQRLLLQQVPVKIVNEAAEQIGLDHLARYSKAGAPSESIASKQLGAQFGSITSLNQGLFIAKEYVKSVQEGQIEQDDAILREINKLCQKLAVFDANNASENDLLQSTDQKLLVLLTSLTSVQGQTFRLVDRLNVLARDRLQHERSSFIHHRHEIFVSLFYFMPNHKSICGILARIRFALFRCVCYYYS